MKLNYTELLTILQVITTRNSSGGNKIKAQGIKMLA